jgi:hypothetical protein
MRAIVFYECIILMVESFKRHVWSVVLTAWSLELSDLSVIIGVEVVVGAALSLVLD